MHLDRFTFLLGLPALRPGALWQRAQALAAPVLISANALSVWSHDDLQLRRWDRFDGRHLSLVSRHPVALHSAGFVAARLYRGFPWPIDAYLDLAASAPWLWWAASDWCVEPEVADDLGGVFDRLSGTVRLNMLCLNGGERRGIADRFVPTIQGWHPDHYLRCLERMSWVRERPLVGVGSMCRRHLHGEHGILHVLDVLDRAFDGSTAKFHLFGLKGPAIAVAAQHPRVASADSQAYGVAARQEARKSRTSKPDTVVAEVMDGWDREQMVQLAKRPRLLAARDWPPKLDPSLDPISARVEACRDELRALHEGGEVEWSDLNPIRAYEMAFLDD